MSVPASSPTPTSKSTLKLEGKAESQGTVLFAFDLVFAGVFRIQNVPQEHVHPLVMIECPRLLFPFAREIVATAVRNGGFPPLLLDPVDFVALYQQRMAQQASSSRNSRCRPERRHSRSRRRIPARSLSRRAWR